MKTKIIGASVCLALIGFAIWLLMPIQRQKQELELTQILSKQNEDYLFIDVCTFKWTGSRWQTLLPLRPSSSPERSWITYSVRLEPEKLPSLQQFSGGFPMATHVFPHGERILVSTRILNDDGELSTFTLTDEGLKLLDANEAESIRNSYQYISDKIKSEGWRNIDDLISIGEKSHSLQNGRFTLTRSANRQTGGWTVHLKDSLTSKVVWQIAGNSNYLPISEIDKNPSTQKHE